MLALEAWDIDDAAAQSTLHVPPLYPRVPDPLCPVPTARVHRRSTRTLADLPWGADAVRLQLGVRQFFCGNAACPRPLCTERRPTVAAPGARQPLRLAERLRALGSARGGAAGTRRTPRFGLVASRDTLVRLVRRLPLPAVPPLSAIGVDAWAPRQRQRSGTIGVD
jgi:transposase